MEMHNHLTPSQHLPELPSFEEYPKDVKIMAKRKKRIKYYIKKEKQRKHRNEIGLL